MHDFVMLNAWHTPRRRMERSPLPQPGCAQDSRRRSSERDNLTD